MSRNVGTAGRICVVIPVKNEESGLESLLSAVFSQDPTPDEVIVVDGGSTDNTLPVLEYFARRESRLKFVTVPGAYPGKGRNIGISMTDADIIVQIDGGCMVEDGWLKYLIDPLLEGRADYVTGNIKPMKIDRKLLGESYDLSAVIKASAYRASRGKDGMAGGASVAYWRRIWERVNGHPEWLRCGSDVVFARKVKLLGIRHGYAGDSVAYWQMGPGLRSVFSRQVRYVAANMVLDKGASMNRSLIRNNVIAVLTIILSLFWSPAWWLLVAGLALYGIRIGILTVGAYFQRNRRVRGRKLLVILAAIAATQLALHVAGEIGLVYGLWYRLKNRPFMTLLERYNRDLQEG